MLKKVNNKPTGAGALSGGWWWRRAVVVVAVYNTITAPRVQVGEEELEGITVE